MMNRRCLVLAGPAVQLVCFYVEDNMKGLAV